VIVAPSVSVVIVFTDTGAVIEVTEGVALKVIVPVPVRGLGLTTKLELLVVILTLPPPPPPVGIFKTSPEKVAAPLPVVVSVIGF